VPLGGSGLLCCMELGRIQGYESGKDGDRRKRRRLRQGARAEVGWKWDLVGVARPTKEETGQGQACREFSLLVAAWRWGEGEKKIDYGFIRF